MPSVPVPNVSGVTMFGSDSASILTRGLGRQALGISLNPDPISAVIVLEGWQTLAEHFATLIPMTDQATQSFVTYSGDFLANLMKEIHRPNIRSGDTFRSISVVGGGSIPVGIGGYQVTVGPETPQSIFLEFGFTHQSGRFIAYPFVFPAADAYEPLFLQGMEQIARLGETLTRPFGGAGAEPIAEVFDRWRSGLYNYSKAAGDLAVFGVTLPGRGLALRSARILGDIQAGIRSTIAKRISVRVAGSFAAFGLRARVSAVATGPSQQYIASANRFYNRFVGAASGRTIGGFFGGIP